MTDDEIITEFRKLDQACKDAARAMADASNAFQLLLGKVAGVLQVGTRLSPVSVVCETDVVLELRYYQ